MIVTPSGRSFLLVEGNPADARTIVRVSEELGVTAPITRVKSG
jgi:hypothetical protein